MQEEPSAQHQTGPADTSTAASSVHTGTPSVAAPTDTTGTPLTYLPQEKRDSIRIEGSWQPITLRLIQPESADPPFLTYMPKDFAFDPVSSGAGDGYYFYTSYSGQRNNNAYLLLFVFPRGTAQAEAIERVKTWVASRGAPAPAQYESFQFRQGGQLFFGSIDLRKHGDRFYYIAHQYPAEFADGFGPRAEKIKSSWKWLI